MASARKYFKLTAQIEAALNSDYSNPLPGWPVEITSEWESHKVFAFTGLLADTTGITVDLGIVDTAQDVGTVEDIIIVNKDTTNYVSAKVRTDASSTNDVILKCNPGRVLILGSDITEGNDLILTANTAAVECDVYVIGKVT